MKTGNKTTRQQQAQKTKNKIYKTAIALMEKKGYANITVDEISKAAHVSVGAFYYYFKSKSDIFFEMYKHADEYFQQVVAKELTEPRADARIVEYFAYYARYNQSVGIDTMKLLYNPDNKWFIAKGRYMQTVLLDIVSRGQECRELSAEMTPDEMVEYLFTGARGVVYHWCLHDGRHDLEHAMNQFISRLVRTITAPDAV